MIASTPGLGMKWNTRSGRDSRVVDRTGWKGFSNYRSIDDRAGVYVFANAALQVKYVGKAGGGRLVEEIRSAISRGKAHGATKVMALYTNSGQKALSLEGYLKNKYKPPNNEI